MAATPRPAAAQRLVPERRTVRSRCRALFNEDHRSVPDGLDDLASLGRTLHRRRADVLACVDHRASNGPTEAINLLIEKVRRVGHGYRNFENYRLRLLLNCGTTWDRVLTRRIRTRSPRMAA